MRIAQVGRGDRLVGDAGDVDEAGERREELSLTRQMVVEGVVDEPEGALAADRTDGRHGRRLRAQRGEGEAERLDQPDEAPLRQKRAQCRQRRLEPGPIGGGAVADRAEHDGAGRTGGGVVGERQRLRKPLGRPLVEALERVDRGDLEAGRRRQPAHLAGRGAIGDRDALEVVADLDRRQAELAGEVEEGAEVEPGCRHVVEGETQGHGSVLKRRAPGGPAW